MRTWIAILAIAVLLVVPIAAAVAAVVPGLASPSRAAERTAHTTAAAHSLLLTGSTSLRAPPSTR